ncbi:putative MFS family arabinose efflux permease [Mycobacterium sp. BK086]|uniref:MFS transporter n=1 Tax=Mycobacterium sp. BK086 TaxID=2512165 RepID=UPI0010622EA0|nr:MFS transporter [Mycobacterium sp. BK086]TDO18352.1 putative MFS family arabinose efflux permease [Mycobacterium sp. BK086]
MTRTVDDPTIVAVQRRSLWVLVVAQVFSGAGLAAGVTVGALLAQDMLGSTGLAGLPSALFTIGSAAASVGVGNVSQRIGRRPGLAAGYATGAVGSVGVVVAAVFDNVALLFAALLIYGAGTATNLQARYAGADLAHPDHRARAISTVLVATTVGAVVGPNLVGTLGNMANTVGIPRLAGPFLLAALAYGCAAVVIVMFLRPDPLILAAEISVDEYGESGDLDRPAHLGRRAVLAGTTVMVLTQFVMVAIMTMTPVHMQAHHHSLDAAGLVISVHIASMYLPSPLSGILVDRMGPAKVGMLAAVVLAAAGLTASLVPAESIVGLAVALGLLGFGWSLGLVSGTTTITDNAPVDRRAKVQGAADLFIAIAGAAGGLGSGLVMAQASYGVLALTGAGLAVVIVPALVAARERRTE